MRYSLRAFTCALAIFLAACTTPESMLDPAERRLSNPKRVAVVSLLPDRFEGVYIGTTAFNNERYTVELPGWNLRQLSEEAAIAQLRGKHRLEALAASVGADVVAPLMRLRGAFERPPAEALLPLARQQGFDTLVVIAPAPLGNSPEFVGGTGYSVRSFMGMTVACAYTSFSVSVYSTSNNRRLGFAPGFMCVTSVPPWKPAFADYTAEERAALTEGGRSLVRMTVPSAVDEALRRAYL